MFKRKFLTNLIFLLVLNFLIKPFWIFGIDRTVQNIVAPGEYGFYFSILNFTFVLNILLDMGITNFNNRNIAQHNFLLNKHFSSLLMLRFVLGLIYMIVIFSVAYIIGYDGRHFYFLAFLSLNQFLSLLILYLRSNISGLLMFKTDSIISVLDRLVMIIICGTLLWSGIVNKPFQIIWFVYSQTIAYGITALTAFFVVVRKAKFKKLNWNLNFFLMILKQSSPFALLVLLMAFYNRIDAVMLERMLPGKTGVLQADIYGKAYRWLDAVNMVSYLVAVLLLPLFSRLLKDKTPVNDIVKISFAFIITFVFVAAVQSCFFSKDIINLLYTSQQSETVEVFKILILCSIPIGMTYIFGTLLTANNNLKALNIVASTGLVLNLTLNFILIPKFYALGSAYSSLTTQAVTALIQIILAFKIFNFKLKKKFTLKVAQFVIGVILLNVVFLFINLPWMYSFAIVLSLSLLLAFATGLVNIKSALILIKSKEE